MKEVTYKLYLALHIQVLPLNAMCLCALKQNIKENFYDLLRDERERPGEHVHVVWQHKWVLRVVILLNLNLVVFKSEHGCLVIIYITIVRCTEYGNNRREFSWPIPLV